MISFSTSQVATTVGVHKRTLLSWLYAGRFAERCFISNELTMGTFLTSFDIKLFFALTPRRFRRYPYARITA